MPIGESMNEHPKPVDLWKHRRRITYSCLVGALITIAAYLREPEKFQTTESIFTACLIFFASVVGCYMGFATYESVKIR